MHTSISFAQLYRLASQGSRGARPNGLKLATKQSKEPRVAFAPPQKRQGRAALRGGEDLLRLKAFVRVVATLWEVARRQK